DSFTAATPRAWRRFSRSYASILPSSLAMNLSSTLESSSQPPVSVWGTGCVTCFSWKSLHWIVTLAEASVYCLPVTRDSTYYSVSTHQLCASVTLNVRRYGNVDPLPIHFPFRVRVRSRLTPG